MTMQTTRHRLVPKSPTLDDCVLLTLASDGQYWTFWNIQAKIKATWGKFYGEPTISAAIRNLRKDNARARYGFPAYGEVVEKRLRTKGKGYEYKLTAEALAAVKEKMNGR